MAWLQKLRQSQNYYVCIWLPNQKRKKMISTGTSNKKIAEKILDRINEIENLRKTEEKFIRLLYTDIQYDKLILKDIDEMHGIDKTITLGAASETFLKSKVPKVKKGTLQSYKQSVKDLCTALGETKRINEIKKLDYDRLLNFLTERYVPSTVNIRQRSIRAFFNWCIEYDYIKKIPFKIKMLKIEQLPKFLMPNEINGIYKYVGDEVMAAIFRVYESTGMRLSELYSSHYEGNYLKIVGKGGKVRFIPFDKDNEPNFQIAIASGYSTDKISRAFTIAWRKHLIHQNPQYLNGLGLNNLSETEVKVIAFKILESQYAKQIKKNRLSKNEKRMAHASGKNLHCFRHTYAVRKWQETGDIYKVKELLGHATVSVTEMYTRYPKEYIKKIME